MTLTTLLELIFGKVKKSEHLRKKAEEFLYLLRDNNFVSVEETKKFINGTKPYYKITSKLRSIGLISLTKDIEGRFTFSLSLDAYKFFIRKHLIEEVENVLRKQNAQ